MEETVAVIEFSPCSTLLQSLASVCLQQGRNTHEVARQLAYSSYVSGRLLFFQA